jgi:hypothetical protein
MAVMPLFVLCWPFVSRLFPPVFSEYALRSFFWLEQAPPELLPLLVSATVGGAEIFPLLLR